MMRRWWLAAIAALTAMAPTGAGAAGDAPKPLFAATDPIRLTIRGPFGASGGGLSPTSQPVDGTLNVQGTPETLAIKLSPRGITRRAHDVCQFVPLRVAFVDKPGDGSPFKGQKSLKLVTHCRPASAFQQYLLLEYAAYKMDNLLTPNSFDVRLALIDYVDKAGRPPTTRLGFFIEDASDVAKRNGLHEVKTSGRVPPSQLAPRDAVRYALFQNLIGNLDWSMTAGPPGVNCCHNSRLLAPQGTGTGMVPLPYDYDFSGMVDAPYATPPEGVPVANVRVRRYRGYCAHNPLVPTMAAELTAQRAALVGVLDTIPQLDDRSRQKAAAYLNGFFDQFRTPSSTVSMLKTCVG